MPNLRRYFLPILEITGILCILIVCAALVFGILSLVTSRFTLGLAVYSIGLQDLGRMIAGEDGKDSPNASDMRQRAVEADHKSVSGWVFDCVGAKGIRDFPSDVQSEFVFPSTRDQYYSSSDKLPEKVRLPFHPERAILALSQAISVQRLALRDEADSSYRFWEATSVVTIMLGMFTTILVSLSSTEFGRGNGRTQKVIRVLAIVFPALGTAAAAVIAFYGPQAEWGQASRTLASLTQLHGQMAIGVWELHCIEKDGDGFASKVTDGLDGWSKRYVDIQTVSTATGGSSAAASAGGQGGGAGGGQGGGAAGGAAGGQQNVAPAAQGVAPPAK
jgi:hypothetical protein